MTPRVGWCGLDRKRLLLRGDEMRGCWEAGATAAPGNSRPRSASEPASTRTFIPVAELAATAPTASTASAATPDLETSAAPALPAILDALPADRRASTDGWTLFGEAEA